MNFDKILEDHKKWLQGDASGVRADFKGADLSCADLNYVDLMGADLSGANLRRANLSRTNLRKADLRGADLILTDLRDSDLRDATLIGVDLRDSCLSYARLNRADLSGADMRGAILHNASMRDVVLDGAVLNNVEGNRREIKTVMLCEEYSVVYTSDMLQIGCQCHAISDWWEFDDKRILEMDGEEALKFWKEWKDTIRMLIEKSPAKSTKKLNLND